MRRATFLGVLITGFALAAGCGNDNGVTGSASPTPTPTGTATPTPTPGSSNVWNISATPPSQTCSTTFPTEAFNVSQVAIDTSGTNFIPDWNLANTPGIGAAGIVSAPAGSVTGTTFNSSWDYCYYDGIFTFHKVWNWTGTLANGGTTFTGSTLTEVLHYANGDLRSTCVSGVTTPLGNCSSPGLTWTIDGTRQ